MPADIDKSGGAPGDLVKALLDHSVRRAEQHVRAGNQGNRVQIGLFALIGIAKACAQPQSFADLKRRFAEDCPVVVVCAGADISGKISDDAAHDIAGRAFFLEVEKPPDPGETAIEIRSEQLNFLTELLLCIDAVGLKDREGRAVGRAEENAVDLSVGADRFYVQPVPECELIG